MAIIPCKQMKCAFILDSKLCPVCSECGSPAHYYESENCVNCHNCIYDSDFIRSGKSGAQSEAEKIQIKEKQIMTARRD